jgi:acetyl esterase/lipase
MQIQPETQIMKHWIISSTIAGLLLSSAAFCAAAEQPTEFSKTAYTFKTVDQLKIKADVYRHGNDLARPVIVWLHGGALIMGSRTGVPGQILELAEQRGFIVVSLGYRLAPEANLNEIIGDLSDGLKWVRESGPELFDADASRIVVAGASAGGYLALMSGITADPPPAAIVSFWGFGDVDGDWTTQPSDTYRKGALIDKEDAWAGVGQQVLTETNQKNGRPRAKFFLYLKQTGRWLDAVSGLDPKTDRDKLTPLCPIRNVTPDFPPTLFLHGTADRDVPVEQSIAMAKELERHGVPNELITIEGGGHSLWGGDRKLIDKAFERSMEYIRERLEQP